jgi:hypothetical protein
MKTIIVHRINWNMGYAAMPPLKTVKPGHNPALGGLPPKERLSCDRLASMSCGYESRERNRGDASTYEAGRGWNRDDRIIYG